MARGARSSMPLERQDRLAASDDTIREANAIECSAACGLVTGASPGIEAARLPAVGVAARPCLGGADAVNALCRERGQVTRVLAERHGGNIPRRAGFTCCRRSQPHGALLQPGIRADVPLYRRGSRQAARTNWSAFRRTAKRWRQPAGAERRDRSRARRSGAGRTAAASPMKSRRSRCSPMASSSAATGSTRRLNRDQRGAMRIAPSSRTSSPLK